MFFIQAFFVIFLTGTNSKCLKIMILLTINDLLDEIFPNFRINKYLRA